LSNSGEFWRFVRFACVGVGNTAIHVCAVTLLVEIIGIAPPPANALAFALANLSSYFLNAAWTFRRQKTLRGYARFVLVGLVGLVISWGCVVSTEALGIHYLVGVLGSVFFVASIGYLLNRKFVFND
jgi:putative flippase GtrA